MQKFISKSKKLNKVLEEAREESYLQVLALGQKKGVPDFAGIGEIITMSDEPEKENWEEEFDRMILRGKFDIGEVKSLIRTQIAEAIQEGYNRGRVKCLEQHGLEAEIKEAEKRGKREEANRGLKIMMGKRRDILGMIEEEIYLAT